MSKKSSEERFGSRGIWEQLETLAREQIQGFVQRLLEVLAAVAASLDPPQLDQEQVKIPA